MRFGSRPHGAARQPCADLLLAVISVALVLATADSAAADGPPFEIRKIAVTGRTVAAEILDLDGDARADLFTVSFSGLPPDEERMVKIFFQREDGSLSAKADLTFALPNGAPSSRYAPI